MRASILSAFLLQATLILAKPYSYETNGIVYDLQSRNDASSHRSSHSERAIGQEAQVVEECQGSFDLTSTGWGPYPTGRPDPNFDFFDFCSTFIQPTKTYTVTIHRSTSKRPITTSYAPPPLSTSSEGPVYVTVTVTRSSVKPTTSSLPPPPPTTSSDGPVYVTVTITKTRSRSSTSSSPLPPPTSSLPPLPPTYSSTGPVYVTVTVTRTSSKPTTSSLPVLPTTSSKATASSLSPSPSSSSSDGPSLVTVTVTRSSSKPTTSSLPLPLPTSSQQSTSSLPLPASTSSKPITSILPPPPPTTSSDGSSSVTVIVTRTSSKSTTSSFSPTPSSSSSDGPIYVTVTVTVTGSSSIVSASSFPPTSSSVSIGTTSTTKASSPPTTSLAPVTSKTSAAPTLTTSTTSIPPLPSGAFCPTPFAGQTCGLAGWGYAENNIYSGTNIDSAACDQLCLSNLNCASFQTQDSSYSSPLCNLYKTDASGNHTIPGAAPYVFYDRGCPDFAPAGCNLPAPTTTASPTSITSPPTTASATTEEPPTLSVNWRMARRQDDGWGDNGYADDGLPWFLEPYGPDQVSELCSCIVTDTAPAVSTTRTVVGW